MQGDTHAAGRQRRVGLQAAQVHAPVIHGSADLLTLGIGTDTADEQGGLAQCLQVPGDIEWCTAENLLAVRKVIEQDLAEQADTFACHGCASAAKPIHPTVSGW